MAAPGRGSFKHVRYVKLEAPLFQSWLRGYFAASFEDHAGIPRATLRALLWYLSIDLEKCRWLGKLSPIRDRFDSRLLQHMIPGSELGVHHLSLANLRACPAGALTE